MLRDDDRRAIEGLFERLAQVEGKAPPRDAEAEALIGRAINNQPGAPYYMAQTILVQEQALAQAQARIEELEREQESGGGFLGGLFGGNTRQAPARQQSQRGPWDRQEQRRGGGGFLEGAAQTALGVTGGILLGNAIAGMFGVGEAQAGEAPADSGDTGQDDGGGDFGGGDDFDVGGDF